MVMDNKEPDKVVQISVPFYGLLPFKLSGKWHWGRQIEETFLINADGELVRIGIKLK